MRILNLEATNFVPCLRKLGHQVLCIGPGKGCDLQPQKTMGLSRLWDFLQSKGFIPDLVLWDDNCRPPSVLGFESLPCPTIGFSIDQYCNPWHIPFSAAFDLILIAQKDYIPQFKLPHLPRSVSWFPLFWRQLPAKSTERDIPVSFVGTVEGSINLKRKQFLQDFKKYQAIFITQGNYIPIYTRSQIVLNQSAVGELNFRIFEAGACGALIVTEETKNGLYDLFHVGRDILTYPARNPQLAAQVCSQILAAPDKLRKIAESGQRKILRDHSVLNRTKTILSKAQELTQNKSYQWRMQNQKLVHKELLKMLFFLGSDKELPLNLEVKQQFINKGLKWIYSPSIS